jgi:hypothetical protein
MNRTVEQLETLKYNLRYAPDSHSLDSEFIRGIVCDCLELHKKIEDQEKLIEVLVPKRGLVLCDEFDDDLLSLFNAVEIENNRKDALVFEIKPMMIPDNMSEYYIVDEEPIDWLPYKQPKKNEKIKPRDKRSKSVLSTRPFGCFY